MAYRIHSGIAELVAGAAILAQVHGRLQRGRFICPRRGQAGLAATGSILTYFGEWLSARTHCLLPWLRLFVIVSFLAAMADGDRDFHDSRAYIPSWDGNPASFRRYSDEVRIWALGENLDVVGLQGPQRRYLETIGRLRSMDSVTPNY